MKAVVHAEKGPFRLVTFHTTARNDVPVMTRMCDIGWFSIGLIDPERPLTPSGRPVRRGIRYKKQRFNDTSHYQRTLFINFGRRTLWFDYLNVKKVTA